jgi:hypothetical protein
MRERFNRPSLLRHLSRFFGGSKEETKKAIDLALEEDDIDNTGRLFFELTAGKGKGKSHASGKRDGEMSGS